MLPPECSTPAAQSSRLGDLSALVLAKGNDVALAKAPLFSLFEGGQNIFARKLVNGVWTQI
jgi:hypothetical protein